ncbi:MAG TPA: DUF3352 domain-containing protein [Candidatus Limnocylindria bacterium]
MLQRLVIALTVFIGLVGATVVAGYLTLFAVGTDRAARAVPADALAYATVYLQPSTGQKMNLALLLGHVPGFSDAANLDLKIHEIAARFLGQAGIDYEADVRPWIGNQLSIAVRPGSGDLTMPSPSLLAAVKDQAAAESGMVAIAAGRGLVGVKDTYRGTTITVADGLAWAVLEDLLIATTDRPSLEAALDAEANARPSLADDAGYAAAMRRLPPDHLASAYLNLAAAAAQAGAPAAVGGYSTVSAALLAEPDGLRLDAVAPFDGSAASAEERADFAAGSEPSTLAEWLPSATQASAVAFDVQRAAILAEDVLGSQPQAQGTIDTLNQLRALAAFGLGINLDTDLLGLFSSEAAIGVSDILTDAPHGQLLLRPADAAAATATLAHVRDAIGGRGGQVSESEAAGLTITTVAVPQVGTVSWTAADGAILAGLTPEDVSAALAAHASGQTVAASERYRSVWELAGDRAGNEAFVDIGAIVDASGDALGTNGDARDILLTVGALGLTAPARDGNTEVHIALTVR